MIGNLYFELDCFTIALKTMIDDHNEDLEKVDISKHI